MKPEAPPNQWVINLLHLVPPFLALIVLLGYFGVALYVLSGKVNLADSTTSYMVGGILAGIPIALVLGAYFKEGIEAAKALRELNKKKED